MENVLLISATNYPDMLDAALVRPGRFDRPISVGAPDLKEREQIRTIHTEVIPLSSDMSLCELAERTDGYVGNNLEYVT